MFVMTKPWPVLGSDEEAERFVADADLSDYDFGQMVPMVFECTRMEREVTIRLPADLFDAVKERAKAQGIPYQRFIREVLEREIQCSRQS
jgi:predicted DNA binding CopG/RHH family protein